MPSKSKIAKNNLYLSIIIVFLFFIILIKVDFWKQLYSLTSNNHHVRMLNTFGMCGKDSYGFLKNIEQNYELTENPLIINTKVMPNSLWTIYDSRKKISNSPKIFLNYQQNPLLIFFSKKDKFVSQRHVQFTNELKSVAFDTGGQFINFKGNIHIFKIVNGKKIFILKTNFEKKINHLEKINISIKTKEFNSRWENFYIEIKNSSLKIKNKINKITLTFGNEHKFSVDDIIYSQDNCYYIK
jgi:hypothetical protein